MAGELQVQYSAAVTVYFLIRNRVGQVWSTTSSSFVAYATADYANYTVAGVEQGTASGFYIGTFPAAIIPGIYSIVAKRQLGGSAAETDPNVGEGDIQWNGSVTLPLSDLTTSGQLSYFLPTRLAKGEMIQSFPIYLKSAADHITPFTSGIVSGQIIRNPVSGSTWGPLQSGEFWETGNGYYSLRSLTSGDLNANTVQLLFNAVAVSGGTSDPLPITLVLQRTSGG